MSSPPLYLTGRWAIEDPNPQEVRNEAKRIEEMGKEAIKGMLDEGIVEAAQTIRALEDGDEEDFYPIEGDEADEEEDRPAKRSRPEGALLSEEAMENLRFYAELSRKQAAVKRPVAKPATGGLAGLGGYSSGDDSD